MKDSNSGSDEKSIQIDGLTRIMSMLKRTWMEALRLDLKTCNLLDRSNPRNRIHVAETRPL